MNTGHTIITRNSYIYLYVHTSKKSLIIINICMYIQVKDHQ